jgi:hypothetical protein
MSQKKVDVKEKLRRWYRKARNSYWELRDWKVKWFLKQLFGRKGDCANLVFFAFGDEESGASCDYKGTIKRCPWVCSHWEEC